MSNDIIILNQMPKLTNSSNIVAFGKARYDVNRIAERNDINVKNVICKFYKIPFLTTFNVLRQYSQLLSQIGKNDNIVIQYPVSCPKAFPIAIKMMHNHHNRVTLLIHDINSFRYQQETSKELYVLNSVDYLIVHTEAMAKLLKKNGVKTKMLILHLFDYLTEDDFISEESAVKNREKVIFAGNLVKSKFLPALCEYDFNDINFNLYGLKDKDTDFTKYKGKNYLGVFDSEHTAQIAGGWGLVWDGNSIDTCAGDLGDYLRYNLPHKLSLYLAAGVPVIVWKQSAVAKFVERNNIGITIESIKDIPAKIDNITEQEYRNLLLNSRKIGTKLRNGEMTMEAIRQL